MQKTTKNYCNYTQGNQRVNRNTEKQQKWVDVCAHAQQNEQSLLYSVTSTAQHMAGMGGVGHGSSRWRVRMGVWGALGDWFALQKNLESLFFEHTKSFFIDTSAQNHLQC